MKKPPRASIVFYDEDAQQLMICHVFRHEVQSVIDGAIARTGGMRVPPDEPDHRTRPLTDEDARKLGGLAMLVQAGVNPELRERLQITTAEPVRWSYTESPPTRED
ncbi:hypothetical protein LJ656_30410 [Paraburkholderia sp. MMS20-SJTR3]|uniref:Uncharacterized protein n=1 Tax=Paraburkholderia sejongensis TaxID=2886946 RepID=A0ABS8K3Z9_9BURK|nr:hypothetical protein [Paraburkholderia sp. MMS20-SJTR3]MCC8396893.1 hypothetical protein [Paraburkholderia sp. MMS20-SJTR3]